MAGLLAILLVTSNSYATDFGRLKSPPKLIEWDENNRVRLNNYLDDIHYTLNGRYNEIGNKEPGVDHTLTFRGEDNSGVITWMEDEAEFRIGDSSNYSVIESDGEIGLVGTARVTVDMYITASGVKAPTANPAAFVEYGLTGAWEFDDQNVEANQEQISGTLKIPTQMDKTAVPIFKIGWSANGVSPGVCEWQLEYLYVGLNTDTSSVAQETLTVTSTASATSDGLIIVSFTGIDLPSATSQAMFFKITRLSAGANDTIADTVELRGMLFTHTRNKLGSAL